MFISDLQIKNFRLFKDNTFKLGRYITAVAGFNATGKSTVLGLLGHCGELKKKHRPLLHSAFKVELSEILKFSEPYDNSITDIGKVIFAELPTQGNVTYPPELSYRSTWQKYKNGKRYRIIPRRTTQWSSSSKITWPTLYLGLGRLYPLGESLDVTKYRPSGGLSEEEDQFILKNMKSILSIREEAKDFTIASISETAKKKGVGFNTDTYNYLSNSAGQDNLGQILMAMLSFKKLKTQLSNNWHGGLLVVDELDAALHPLAQNKLVDFLYRQAKEIGMQIVFTSHSLGLLEYICIKTEHNGTNTVNDYELVSVSNANGPIEVLQNPSFDAMYKELMATYQTPCWRKISVFSEDNEGRVFIKKLLEQYVNRFKLLDASFGREELLKMLTDDFVNFSQYIYILDGDVTDTCFNKYTQKVAPYTLRCVLKLPGDKRPEQLIWEYLIQLPDDHEFLTRGRREGLGYTLRSFEEYGPFSSKYNGYEKERDKFKQWFNNNLMLINDVLDYWCNDNKEDVEEFIAEFVTAYNWIARRWFIPKIRPQTTVEEVISCQQPSLL